MKIRNSNIIVIISAVIVVGLIISNIPISKFSILDPNAVSIIEPSETTFDIDDIFIISVIFTPPADTVALAYQIIIKAPDYQVVLVEDLTISFSSSFVKQLSTSIDRAGDFAIRAGMIVRRIDDTLDEPFSMYAPRDQEEYEAYNGLYITINDLTATTTISDTSESTTTTEQTVQYIEKSTQGFTFLLLIPLSIFYIIMTKRKDEIK